MLEGMATAHLPSGKVLLGRFRIETLIGEGGMGSVYRAWHLALETPVAIKLLRWDSLFSSQSQARLRFEREARGLARVRSEYICRPLDFGELESGEPYLVLEYLEGLSLAQLEAPRMLAGTRAVDIALQVAAGLAEAHRVGLVHRDIKPSNVFLSAAQGGRQIAKLVDFGIVKTLGSETAITRGNEVVGTPEYMSPEQIGAPETVDRRTDIWSLGALMFWMFSGERPFTGDTKLELLTSVLSDEPRRLASLRPDLPAPISQAVDACLVRDMGKRLASVAELAARLAPFASLEGQHAAALAMADAPRSSSGVHAAYKPSEATELMPKPARTVEFRTPKK
jgi:eukaryotic-like serine/threonine-protein kinase